MLIKKNVKHSCLKKMLMASVVLGTLATGAMNVNHQNVHASSRQANQALVVKNSNRVHHLKFNKNGLKNTKNNNQIVKKVHTYKLLGNTTVSGHRLNKSLRIAQSKLGDRYVWGGNGPHVFDCSGFTKYVFQHGTHKALPRTAGAQYYENKKVSKAHRKAGDLVFFGGSKASISHVGLYLGHDLMIDAQNRGVVVEHVSAPWWHAVGYSRPVQFR